MSIRPRNKVDATFNMSSMTDIVFLLLIFFIVLSTFVTVHGLDIDLPKTTATVQPVHTNIVVEISRDNEYMVSGTKTTYEGVISALKSRITGEKNPSLVFIADATISWETGMEVIAEAKKMGYEKIVVKTQVK